MAFHRINLTVNSELEQVDVASNMTLLQMLLITNATRGSCTYWDKKWLCSG
jgi:aerobic-type carbon monoxide dehydrogenase small subunit (CoxS/CutS family)